MKISSMFKKIILMIPALLLIGSSTGLAVSPSMNKVAWSTQLWSEPGYTEQWSTPTYTEQWSTPTYTEQWSTPEYTEQWSEPEYTEQWSEPVYTDQWWDEVLNHLDQVEAGAPAEPPVYIRLQIDSTKAIIQDKETTLSAPPRLINGATMVPLRFIGEALGATVDWNAQEQKITLSAKGKNIVLKVNQSVAQVNGKEVKLSEAPIIKDGVTLVPLRFIGESLDLQVNYTAATKTIEIGNQQSMQANTPTPPTQASSDSLIDFEQLYGTWYMWSGASATELYYKDTGNYATHIFNASEEQGVVTINTNGTYSINHANWGAAEGKWRLSFPAEINGERIIGIVLLDGPTNVNWAVAPSPNGKVRLLYEMMDRVWTIDSELYRK